MDAKAPELPQAWEEVFQDIEKVIMPGVMHFQSPRRFNHWTLASSYASMLGQILTDAIGCLGPMWESCPMSVELEMAMMDWLAQMLGLPDVFLFSHPGQGGGMIQGNASEATLTCLLAARTLSFRKQQKSQHDVTLGQVIDRLVAYCSDQAHCSVAKAAMVGGVRMRALPTDDKGSLRGVTLEAAILEDKAKGLLPFFAHCSVAKAAMVGGVRMRALPTDDKGSLRGVTLEAAILEDKAKGLLPFFCCATCGSTASCAFDSLKELGPVCEQHDLWMHVDAAYAGSAFICPEFRYLMEGMEFATSFNFNAHKWLKVNYECSPLWVKNTEHLQSNFVVEPLYLKQAKRGDVMPVFIHWQVAATSHPCRALKVWFVLRLYGVQGLQDYIRHDVKMAHEFEALVRSDVRFEITADVIMGLVCFRLKGPNHLTEDLLKQLRKESHIILVPSDMKGVFFLRLAICGPYTLSADVTYAWGVITHAAGVILASINGHLKDSC